MLGPLGSAGATNQMPCIGKSLVLLLWPAILCLRLTSGNAAPVRHVFLERSGGTYFIAMLLGELLHQVLPFNVHLHLNA